MTVIIYISLALLFSLLVMGSSYIIGYAMEGNEYEAPWMIASVVAAIELVVILYLKGMIPA